MANALACTAAQTGANSGTLTFSNGASGAADTIANAQLIKAFGSLTSGQLNAFLTASFADATAVATAADAIGLSIQLASLPDGSAQGGFTLSTWTWVASTSTPSATVTTTSATGGFRIKAQASITA